MSDSFIFEPTLYFDSIQTTSSYALIILNQHSDDPPPYAFSILWRNAQVKICSDGGANALLSWIKCLGQQFIPDHIHGDLDSLDRESRDYFSSNKCSITKDSSQSSTDFTKAVRLISSQYPKIETIWAIGELSNRFDHTMGMIQTLYLFPKIKLYIVTRYCIVFMIPSGKNNIILKRSLVGKNIGLLPIGHPIKQIVTNGLKWNISHGQILQFGSLISTSNTFSEESESSTITVNTDGELIFTVDFPS